MMEIFKNWPHLKSLESFTVTDHFEKLCTRNLWVVFQTSLMFFVKRWIVILIPLIVFACGTNSKILKPDVPVSSLKTSIKTLKMQIPTNSVEVSEVKQEIQSFGPWMMPIHGGKNAVSVMYFTTQPESTDLYFSMAGDVDWARGDSRQVQFHKMDFTTLEYSAHYDFEVDTKEKDVFKNISLKTQPWGEAYRFRFQVADSSSLKQISNSADFLILTGSVSEKEDFSSLYRKYTGVLTRTVFVPTQELKFKGGQIGFMVRGVGYWDYRDYRIVILNQQFSDLHSIEQILAENSFVILVCDGANPKLIQELYTSYADRIPYVITTKDLSLENQSLVNGLAEFEVEKKSSRKMAMNRSW